MMKRPKLSSSELNSSTWKCSITQWIATPTTNMRGDDDQRREQRVDAVDVVNW